MKNIINLFFILLFASFCSAQHMEYNYDASGNRYQRIYLFPRLANPEQNEAEKKMGLSVYPNPTPNKLNVSISTLEEGTNENADLYISDSQGKILLVKKQNSTLEELDLSNLQSGIYYLRIFIRSETITYKIEKF